MTAREKTVLLKARAAYYRLSDHYVTRATDARQHGQLDQEVYFLNRAAEQVRAAEAIDVQMRS